MDPKWESSGHQLGVHGTPVENPHPNMERVRSSGVGDPPNAERCPPAAGTARPRARQAGPTTRVLAHRGGRRRTEPGVIDPACGAPHFTVPSWGARADAMLEKDDLGGYAVFQRIVRAAEELLSKERPPGVSVQ